MNIVEKLAGEIERVTGVRAQFEALRGRPNVIVEPQIAMMTESINRAKQALGSGDPEAILATLNDLNGWEE